jgi:predicted secreted hydrolase
VIRRHLLWGLAATWPALTSGQLRIEPRSLRFPRDHGAHPAFRIEWWYATGTLQGDGDDAGFGFQLTFFRSRTGLGDDNPSRFAPRHLLFAHAALTDLGAGRFMHAERVARWSGDPAASPAAASVEDTHIRLGDWSLERAADGVYHASLGDADAGFAFALQLAPSQPVLLQGDAGFSRKGPALEHASHYYSQPQLGAKGHLQRSGRRQPVRGKAWLDHEWSESLLHPQAVGWDWLGINLDDGGALTAFRLRRADGSALWAGGSHRSPQGPVRSFGPQDVVFVPGRVWTSPRTAASYPVQWRIETPAGRFEL